MKLRSVIALLAWGCVLGAAAMIFSCNSSSGAGLSATCSLNSDCNSPLVCAFAKCHAQCVESRDCPNTGERCVSGSAGTARVCQLPPETGCAMSATCSGTQVCSATDQQCRQPCQTNTDCAGGQFCVMSGAALACLQASTPADEPALMTAGILSADGAVLVDASGGGSTGPGGDATVGAGDSGGVFNPCPAAQEQFGFVAQGDANPSYTSGVGVRTATQLLVFNGYAGVPASGVDAGDAGSVNLVYVQAFDPATAKSLGPPTLLFQAPDGGGFIVANVAIAPSGQIALVFLYGGFSGSGVPALYAAFLAPSSPDGAAGTLHVGQIVQLETARHWGQPHVIWSTSNQAFVFSWECSCGGWETKLAQFLPDGRPASGATGIVPTDHGGAVASTNQVSGAPATSGSEVGVGYLSSSGQPYLTRLDAMGNQIGSSIQLASFTGGQWIGVAGTSQGFVTFYDNGTSVSEAFIAVSADAGVPGASTDGGDAGALPGFVLPGAADALDVRAISDDQGGPGGVGAVLLYPAQVAFAYVNPSGQGPLAHLNTLFAHSVVTGDFVAISNYRGLFAVSLYDNTKHSTQMIASGCQ